MLRSLAGRFPRKGAAAPTLNPPHYTPLADLLKP